MAPLDIEMASIVHEHLKKKGIQLQLGDGVVGFEQGAGGKGLVVKTAVSWVDVSTCGFCVCVLGSCVKVLRACAPVAALMACLSAS